ncbi:hypothetical protein ENUP19_0253G0029 [Entamoeba nuttalli]|uniref:Autophagy protein 5 n=2 Tax=Entamoeba nuttalli TaxID=412467 RepID=K2H125_ENTNP|nr:autophagy protein apg5 protein [Entamoeba nuttalli P19]EKE41193.1 autophagy protein apg5 protein [Entamoeba nuttalli P19]|eukprot:XP_008856474.1 autophagy protein apg5 protein [Entamoeba nuttalli P19]
MQVAEYSSLIDSTIKRKVIEGTIPLIVRIPFKNEEKFTLYNASRNEYLPFLLKNSLTEFLQEVEQPISSVTYTVNEQNVKWYFPIGVIFDALHNGSLPMEITIGISQNQSTFQPYENEETIKNYHIQQLKESVYLRYGSIQTIRQLAVESITPLWECHAQNKLEEYEQLLNPILITGENWQNIPIHWYFGSQRRYTDCIPVIINDHLTTLIEGLQVFLKERDINDNDPPSLQLLKTNAFEQCPNLCIVIQGITIPLDTPLLWLALNLSHSDLFLHVVIRKTDELLIVI